MVFKRGGGCNLAYQSVIEGLKDAPGSEGRGQLKTCYVNKIVLKQSAPLPPPQHSTELPPPTTSLPPPQPSQQTCISLIPEFRV